LLEALGRPAIFSSRRSLGEPAPDDPSAYMPMIVILDPPRHDELRALVSRAFTPRRIAALEPRIRANSSRRRPPETQLDAARSYGVRSSL